MQEKFIRYDGLEIYYRVAGSGQPLVFIHGFGEDGNVWKNQVEFFQGNFLVIVPDLPGSGRSEIDNNPWTMDRFAALIKEIIIRESISSFFLFGHSMGGYIALAYAEKFSSDLKGLGLLHSTSYPDSEEKKTVRKKGI